MQGLRSRQEATALRVQGLQVQGLQVRRRRELRAELGRAWLLGGRL